MIKYQNLDKETSSDKVVDSYKMSSLEMWRIIKWQNLALTRQLLDGSIRYQWISRGLEIILKEMLRTDSKSWTISYYHMVNPLLE